MRTADRTDETTSDPRVLHVTHVKAASLEPHEQRTGLMQTITITVDVETTDRTKALTVRDAVVDAIMSKVDDARQHGTFDPLNVWMSVPAPEDKGDGSG